MMVNLVIDDDELVLSTLEIILSKAGHAVLTATNGRDGLTLWATQRPDLLITDILNVDILSPELDGIETIRAIRAKAGDSPIIAMSGSDQSRNSDLLQMARNVGAQ